MNITFDLVPLDKFQREGFISFMDLRKKGSTRGTLFLEIAKMRLGDSFVLLKGKRFHGAIYLVGYSVECALKWAVTRRNEQVYLPAELETHDLEWLLKHSGLANDLQRDQEIQILFSALIDEWGPAGRYDAGTLDPKAATRLYNQIREVYSWIIEKAA